MALTDVRTVESNYRSSGTDAFMWARRARLGSVCRHLAAQVPWEHLRGAETRKWELLGSTTYLDAWLIAWPPLSGVELHDHGSSRGALFVLDGGLVELTPRQRAHGGFELSERRLKAGQAREFEPHDIHDVYNGSTDASAVSVHVYSPPLQSMTYFDVHHGDLVPRRTEQMFASTAAPGGVPAPIVEAQ